METVWALYLCFYAFAILNSEKVSKIDFAKAHPGGKEKTKQLFMFAAGEDSDTERPQKSKITRLGEEKEDNAEPSIGILHTERMWHNMK